MGIRGRALATRRMAREMAAARRNRRTHAARGAAALVGALGQGCGDSTVVYRAPDAAPWGEACTGWDLSLLHL